MFQVLTHLKINIRRTATGYAGPSNFQDIFFGVILDKKFRPQGMPGLFNISNWCAWGGLNFNLKEKCLHVQEKQNQMLSVSLF